MMIDISNLLIRKDNEIPIDCEIIYTSEQIDLNVDRIEVALSGRLFRQNDSIFVDVEYKANIILPCSRCLEITNYVLENNLYDMLCDSKGTVHEEMENLLNGHGFSIKEYLLDDLIINEDSQVLCSDDCLGLCPECGINLNYEKCTCEEMSIDSRFSALKDFFADEGGVENGSTKEKDV